MKISKLFGSILGTGALAVLLAGASGAQTFAPAARHAVPAHAEIRAIYLTGASVSLPRGKRMAEQWRAEGGNAVVFDVKDNTGPVSINAPLALAGHVRRPYIPNLGAWVGWLHAHGLYAIARIAVFQDQRLVDAHPELAVHSRATGKVWWEHGVDYWVDPSQAAVQDYNIALAKLVAEAGVDEVQFDAIRFPVQGNQRDARFAYEATHPNEPRQEIITSFLRRAQQALAPTGVRLSIDVYGITGWEHAVDLKATGQNIVQMAHYCNVICPMIYPSHFFGHFDGYAVPSSAPEHFIETGMRRFQRLTREENVVIRPWLQAFHWHTPTFGPSYVERQVATERAQNGGGFMLWNAGNLYGPVYAAMPAMLAGGSKYFQGGYPYAIAAPEATAAPARTKRMRR
ncbi:MAG: putative glycoside hydrolase [Terriglobales bacterium]